jgi:hypothetical protein
MGSPRRGIDLSVGLSNAPNAYEGLNQGVEFFTVRRSIKTTATDISDRVAS